jgi:cytochrome c oxidase subunit 3
VHAHLAHHFDDIEQQRTTEAFGMWVFLATEIMIFGALFISYAAYRSWYPRDFEAASAHLNVLIGSINTVVLLTSSFTMAMAVYFARLGRRGLLLLCLGLTIALGVCFLGFKAYEYYSDWRDHLVPLAGFDAAEWQDLNPPADPGHVQLMLWLYYTMTGLHSVHLIIGLGLLAWVAGLAGAHQLSAEHYMPVEIVGLYWHFVDTVWIFLLPLLYLSGTHAVSDLHF